MQNFNKVAKEAKDGNSNCLTIKKILKISFFTLKPSSATCLLTLKTELSFKSNCQVLILPLKRFAK